MVTVDCMLNSLILIFDTSEAQENIYIYHFITLFITLFIYTGTINLTKINPVKPLKIFLHADF